MIVFKNNFLMKSMDGLLIGRFQPFHLGHLDALRFALTKVENLWLGLEVQTNQWKKQSIFC